ncbi:UNVERIFIED_CONTAM: hypothetical protein Slati_2364000 [Sesamum latifolium]|uniref:Reverse transcriptase domain-containing protein n=1 Tax=Sesamum latifolium TaxID=2727402 RepID=A0AAW2WF57_9LAMI
MFDAGSRKTRETTGVAVAEQAPRVSHLLFADDTLVFCEANETQIGEIQRILNGYEKASGQVINFQKSSMVIGGRMSELRKVQLAAILGVRVVPFHERYLGLPATSGRSRGALFQGIKDRIWDRISGWNSKLLSQAGKSVLVKSVLQSLPTYVMSCFQIPEYLIRHIESTTADFWWHCRGEKRIHWVAWQKLCRPVSRGGWFSGVEGV